MMNLNALKIDPEFQGKIPPLNAEEEHILEQNMIQERRLLNPLIIWNGYILDGHSRYRILKHHPEIAFEVKEIQLPDRYAALAWICQNQLGRRNLDPERRKFLMGKTYENEKLSVGGSIHREHAPSLLALRGTDFVICNDHGFPINPDSYGALVRRIGQRAGIEGLHPHMFRHTFVSILLSNPEIGVATVAAEAGHAQPSTTLAIYTQVYDKRRKEIRNQMSKELYE